MHLNKKAKLEFFNNFDSSQGNKSFWVKCNLTFANTFNEYFGSIVESLDLHICTEDSSNVPPSNTSDDAIDNILIKFLHHPSIKQSNKVIILLVNFHFNLFF